MRTKQRYGGLSPHYVRLIRAYLRKAREPATSCHTLNIYNVWMWIVLGGESAALSHAQSAGLGQTTVNALKAGLAVLKRKRIGRVCDYNAAHSFAAIGITTGKASA